MNLYDADALLVRSIHAAGGKAHHDHLSAFGARVGSAEAIEFGIQANRHPPVLKSFDRWGRRIDEVEFHPAYHALMAMGLEAGISSCAWTH